jgi:hypothetical protein
LVRPEIFSPDLMQSKGNRNGPPVGGAAHADDTDAATTANARIILTLHLVVSLARRQNRWTNS